MAHPEEVRLPHTWLRGTACCSVSLQSSACVQAQPCTLARDLRQVRFTDTLCHSCSEAAHRVGEVLCSSCCAAGPRVSDTLCHGCSRPARGGESHDVELSVLSRRKSGLLAEGLVTN